VAGPDGENRVVASGRVCAYVCVCVCVSMRVYVCVCGSVCMRACCNHICVAACVCVCLCVCLSLCVCVCVCMHACVCVLQRYLRSSMLMLNSVGTYNQGEYNVKSRACTYSCDLSLYRDRCFL